MSERYGADYIHSTLSNAAAVTAIVSASIYEGLKVPSTDSSTETINFYRTGPFNGGLEYFESRYSIDCRASDYLTSRNLASEAFTALNRDLDTVNSKRYFAVCSILATIPPVNETDVYNTPVEAYIRRK